MGGGDFRTKELHLSIARPQPSSPQALNPEADKGSIEFRWSHTIITLFIKLIFWSKSGVLNCKRFAFQVAFWNTNKFSYWLHNFERLTSHIQYIHGLHSYTVKPLWISAINSLLERWNQYLFVDIKITVQCSLHEDHKWLPPTPSIN